MRTSATIEIKYDRFKDQTVMRLKPMPMLYGGNFMPSMPREDLSISLLTFYSGDKLTATPPSIGLYFESKSFHQRSADNRETIVLADGERFRLGSMRLINSSIKLSKPIEEYTEVLSLVLLHTPA